MSAPISTPLNSHLITSTTITISTPTPTQTSIPIPTAECVSIYSFPEDIRVTLLRKCDTNTIGMLALTCKTLYGQILNQNILSSSQLSEICSNLLQQQNLTGIQAFCKKILPQCKERSVDLIISNPWQDLVSAVDTIKTYLPISSLTMHGKKIHSSDILTAFEICSRFSVKKLVLTHCMLDDGLENVPVSLAIEEIQFLHCTVDEHKKWFSCKNLPSLKRFIVQDCGHHPYSLINFSVPSIDDPYPHQIEYFSDMYFGEYLVDDPKNGVITYINAHYDLLDYHPFDEDNCNRGMFLGYQVHQPADEDFVKNIIESLRKSIEASPRFVRSKVLLGQLIANKQPQETENLFRESIEIYPEDIRARVLLGMILLRMSRIEEGAECLEQAASMCKHPSTYLYMEQIIKALIKHKPSISFPLLRQLIRKTSYVPLLTRLKNEIGYYLAYIKYAVFVPLQRTEVCSYLKERLLKEQNGGFAKLVSMQKYNNQDLFTEIEPWLSIFQTLKVHGENIMPLLDNFLIVDFQIPGGMFKLFKFLSRPEWNEERQLFLRHFSEKGSLSFLKTKDFLDHLKEIRNNNQVIQELCKAALDIGDIDTQYLMLCCLETPALAQIGKEVCYNLLRLDPDNFGACSTLTEYYKLENKNELSEKFAKKVSGTSFLNFVYKCTEISLGQESQVLKILGY